MKREYYSDSISAFLVTKSSDVFSKLAQNNEFALEQTQRDAWLEEIDILQKALLPFRGSIYFEYSIPRMGKRIDVVLIIGSVIFILEFKVGDKEFTSYAVDQVYDYALDLKNFHEPSHKQFVAPILIATKAKNDVSIIGTTPQNDKLLSPIKCNSETLTKVITDVLTFSEGENINTKEWETGRYCPTPTIIEAAMALYRGHSVTEISRSDASATNLSQTSEAISDVIRSSKANNRKSVCFLTGVPGAGKTLVGLNIANIHSDESDDLYSVFLSGNGPLVDILREALARDKVRYEREKGKKIKKGDAMSVVKVRIQNVHNFRDECLLDERPPREHVALFDEAQRAWTKEKTIDFMRRKKGKIDFKQSEPGFLISCLDRHNDWAVIVCLVGGGQEIHTGEAGIKEWLDALSTEFGNWHMYISSRLTDNEYAAGRVLEVIKSRPNVTFKDELHLAVSMRSFRAEKVSLLVKQILDLEVGEARDTLSKIEEKYPIVITRDISKAKLWLKNQARGSERYGIVVSSQAERLKPQAIFVKSTIDPIHWFLDGKEDTRSSYYLEDVATEFQVQGLEIDWACVVWDADFRRSKTGWEHRSFIGSRWNHIRKLERQNYLKNAYRVLLTRARQGIVIVVPEGDPEDPTRSPDFYNATFEYLKEIGIKSI